MSGNEHKCVVGREDLRIVVMYAMAAAALVCKLSDGATLREVHDMLRRLRKGDDVADEANLRQLEEAEERIRMVVEGSGAGA